MSNIKSLFIVKGNNDSNELNKRAFKLSTKLRNDKTGHWKGDNRFSRYIFFSFFKNHK